MPLDLFWLNLISEIYITASQEGLTLIQVD